MNYIKKCTIDTIKILLYNGLYYEYDLTNKCAELKLLLNENDFA